MALDNCAQGSLTEEFYDEGYLEEDADMDDDLGVDFDHGDDDSDSGENANEDDEVDAELENEDVVHGLVPQESNKDIASSSTSSIKRSFGTYTADHLTGHDERKRRKP